MRLIPLLLGLLPLCATAADKQLLWGDTHLHTSYSPDAYMNNNFTADPNTAYRYAMGEPVIHPFHRARVQIGTPLDFLVVSDHAEFLGEIRSIHQNGLNTDGMGLWESLKGQFAAWYLNRALDNRSAFDLFFDTLPAPGDVREEASQSGLGGNAGLLPRQPKAALDTWRSQTELADAYYEPGTFTPFIGWEWSSMPGAANLHRVVMMDGDKSAAQTFQPFSLQDSMHPQDLWNWLEETSNATGASFLSIPHNSNVSKGFMFDTTRLNGEAFDAEDIARRMKYEPVVEITQIKGDSEAHPSLSPDDEFADFEEFPFYLSPYRSEYIVKPGDYIRSALKRGLALEQEFGQNPYQFGVIGSTDSHAGVSSAEEDNFWGKMATDSTPETKTRDWEDEDPGPDGWIMSASGLAAVWAEENTRESIMEAMRRREVYASTGPRIRLQFFGADDFGDIDLASAALYTEATSRGVPMGGELPGGSAPEFLVLADRDPVAANLDRIQVVKGWLDDSGAQREVIYDVAWSGDRQPGADGKLPAVGNTVDLRTGQVDDAIGAPQLSARWRDPDYQAGQAAFYYVRVIQIPTARHSLLDAIALGREHAGDHPDTIQERAYSSPIWIRAN